MIRTGYLRWEIEAADARSPTDQLAREVTLLARPSYRAVRVLNQGQQALADRFARGEIAYERVLAAQKQAVGREQILQIPDVGPTIFRYSESDRARTPRFWMEKLQREISAFAHEVVRVAGRFPALVIANPALRLGYARLVEYETFRVIEGRSQPQPTIEDEPMQIELQSGSGIPELVAAELVRDVVEPREFDEFRHFNRVTIKNGDKIYRISRRSHALIEVWDAKTLRGLVQLCVVFQDQGMPPSDEVVMKYLLAKHQPDMLWQVGIRFQPPTGKFEANPYQQERNSW